MFARRALWCCAALTLASATGCSHGPAPIRMALVAGADGLGGSTFSAQAAAGLAACSKVTGAVTTVATASPAGDFEGAMGLLATENFDPVVAVGAPMEGPVAAAARRFEGTHFDVLDGSVPAKNVTSIRFADGEGGYLAGALAASVTRTHRVAFLGGAAIGRLASARAGFTAGVRAIDPSVRVATRYVGSFTDAAAGHRAEEALTRAGVDVTFVDAGPAGLGAIAALRGMRGRYAIGADADQDAYAPGVVLSSVVKRFDVAADRACREAVSQKPSFGTLTLGVADGAVGLTRAPAASGVVTARILARLGALQRAIADGRVVPPR